MAKYLLVALLAVLLSNGCGGSPKATLSVGQLDFGSQTVGTTSVEQSITLSNMGSAKLRIQGISTTTGFRQTNSCGAGVDAGGHCTVNVAFSPASEGTVTGSVSFTDNAIDSPQHVMLSGAGLEAPSCSQQGEWCDSNMPCCSDLVCVSFDPLLAGTCKPGRMFELK